MLASYVIYLFSLVGVLSFLLCENPTLRLRVHKSFPRGMQCSENVDEHIEDPQTPVVNHRIICWIDTDVSPHPHSLPVIQGGICLV